jgi:hypothetical protein
MLVEITKVDVTRAPKGYSIAEVTYLRDGKEEQRKLMSFVNEGVFQTVTTFKNLPVAVNVVLAKELNKKDGKEYWQWKAVEHASAAGAEVSGTTSSQPKGKVLGSNYETPTERAKRQVYIVRQSSLSNAVAYYAAVEPKGITVEADAIIDLADRFASYVLDVSEPEVV